MAVPHGLIPNDDVSMPLQNRSKVPIGTVLEDKYRITGELGRGGMATVYEAQNIDIGKRVAVKVLAAELVTSRIVRERFIREARAAAAIRSPYICDVYDSGMYEERPFLVMELLEGESLYDRMTRVRRIDVRTTVRVMALTARGLGKAHEAGVVHRDMKPENIFLLKSEEGELTVKIVDFGLAKFYEPTKGDPSQVRLTRQGALFGTPAYMSPEQAKGQGEVDHRADLWALGCITYECLTGRTVWKVDQGVAMILAQIAGAPLPRPSAYRKDLPEAFDRWFFKALDRDINQRFQTAKQFTEALDEALGPVSELLSETPAARARPPPLAEPRQGLDTDPMGRPESDAFESRPLPSASPSAMDEAEELTPSGTLPGPIPRPRPRSGQAIATLVATAIVVLTGYALWLYVLYPPQPQPAGGVDPGKADTPPDPSARPQLKPVEREPYALQIGAAQEWLSRGRLDNAVKMFKEAFTNGGSGVARALLYHAALAQEATPGPCRVTGLGRPRPFEVTAGSSPPTLAVTQAGPVVAWVDNNQQRNKWQGQSTLLDSSLRRVGPALVVTPEVQHARSPEFVSAGEKLALIYCVRGSPDGGVYVRLLEQDGRIAGKARHIATIFEPRFSASLAPTGSGSFWLVWEQEQRVGVSDLMVRPLNAELRPLGEAVPVTRFLPEKAGSVGVRNPAAAVAHRHLYLLYVVERSKTTQVMLQRIALSDPGLKLGLVNSDTDLTLEKKRKKKRGKAGEPEQRDRFLGAVQPISTEQGKNAQPRIACVYEGCFVVWDDEQGGALAAFIDGAKGEKLWHREVASRGARPNVTATKQSAALAWYDGGRVKLARIDRDGPGEASVLARVKGYQPAPAIVPGVEPGRWYIAWRAYEAGHLETFVVRAQCQ